MLTSFPLNNKKFFPPTQSLNQKFKPQHIVGFDLKEIVRLPQKLSLCAKVLLLRMWFPSLQQSMETGEKCRMSGPTLVLLHQNLCF